MDAVIAAGGKGTRLGELTREIPKCLVPVAGKPLLGLQLDELARNGIGKAWLLTGHLGDSVDEYVKAYEGPVEVESIREIEPLGTGGSLAALAGAFDEAFAFLYGDLVLSLVGLDVLVDRVAQVTGQEPGFPYAVSRESSS